MESPKKVSCFLNHDLHAAKICTFISEVMYHGKENSI